jgi:hypothetical protein
MLPGFGGYDSMDWRAFLETLMQLGYDGPFVIENEGANSAHTGNLGATVQGFRTAVLCLAPIVWPLRQNGYEFDRASLAPQTRRHQRYPRHHHVRSLLSGAATEEDRTGVATPLRSDLNGSQVAATA